MTYSNMTHTLVLLRMRLFTSQFFYDIPLADCVRKNQYNLIQSCSVYNKELFTDL